MKEDKMVQTKKGVFPAWHPAVGDKKSPKPKPEDK